MPLRRCPGCGRMLRRKERCPSCTAARQAVYDSPPVRRWRGIVLARAGYRCEFVDQRTRARCGATTGLDAHHVTPLAMGGSPADPANGEALCRKHHGHRARRG